MVEIRARRLRFHIRFARLRTSYFFGCKNINELLWQIKKATIECFVTCVHSFDSSRVKTLDECSSV